MSKTYIDWRGPDEGLLASFKSATTLTTVAPTFVNEGVIENDTELIYEIDVQPILEEDRRALYNLKGEDDEYTKV